MGLLENPRIDLRLFEMMMVIFKMGLASFLPTSMAIPGMAIEKGEDGEEGTWPGQLSPLQNRPGLVFSDCWP